MDPAWYRTFFDGITVDFWRLAATPEWTQRDVELAWRELNLKAGDHVLDCPCGHGRHAVELARRGCRILGIDVSSYCLTLAREAAAVAGVDIELRQGDMLELANLPTIDAAITLGNSFGYLDHAGMSRFCCSVATALRPGGRWLIEPCAVAESLLPTLKPEREYTLGPIHVHSRNRYLTDESCLETTYECTRDGHTQSFTNWHFIFTTAEIRRMLMAVGLHIVGMYGTATGEPYALGSPFLYLVAEKSPHTS